MRAWAEEDGTAFPPRDYWKSVAEPSKLRYRTIPRRDYARERMNGIPVDDDLQYTLLGLLILEDFGPGFTTEDVARAWQTYLPFACTAEDVALTNLRRGVPALQAADPDGVAPAAQACFMSEDRAHGSAGAVANPYNQWIGADIRADPRGYVAPGRPGGGVAAGANGDTGGEQAGPGAALGSGDGAAPGVPCSSAGVAPSRAPTRRGAGKSVAAAGAADTSAPGPGRCW